MTFFFPGTMAEESCQSHESRSQIFEETLDCSGDNPPTKRARIITNPVQGSTLRAHINQSYLEKSFKQMIGTAFEEATSERDLGTSASILNEPFTCCILPNFVKENDFLEGLKEELLELNFINKSNDLYKFQQSEALQNFTSPHILALRKLLYDDFLSWLKDVTRISFSDTVDMTCSKYNHTDVLLCHDDELDGRRIAFILYLVPPWQEADGGLLDLFDMDEHGQPKSVVKSLVPKWNNLVFFEVTPKSFHQVSEVLSSEKCRLSVSGWFHGPTVPRQPPYKESRKALTSHMELEESVFCQWISDSYLNVVNQSEVQDTFSEASEIQLPAFFEKKKFDEVYAALQREDIKWEKCGPPNKRCYEVGNPSTLPAVVQECVRVMQSEFTFLLFSNFTALKLHEQAPCGEESDEDEQRSEGQEEERVLKEGKEDEQPHTVGRSTENDAEIPGTVPRKMPTSNPQCRAELRRWTHGCYTLLHDTDTEGSEFALDASIFFNTQNFSPDGGGFVSYIARGEDEELLNIFPEDNSLCLVYRDKDTLRFVKHINQSFVKSRETSSNKQSAFYELYLVFYE
ncbi:prolyl 3-hydroxylase OGFOD1-like [Diadema antillarum]|uniref:prolyl 3-hydroxylase OGFOD1-like n=1 Tax=Diadema antillarum TaxID=105358 RepID=UPI003A85984C